VQREGRVMSAHVLMAADGCTAGESGPVDGVDVWWRWALALALARVGHTRPTGYVNWQITDLQVRLHNDY